MLDRDEKAKLSERTKQNMPERFGKVKAGLVVFSAGGGQGVRKERFGKSGSFMAPCQVGGFF